MAATVTEFCPNCNQPLRDGEFVTGLSWSGDGGAHIRCPEPVTLVVTPVDEHKPCIFPAIPPKGAVLECPFTGEDEVEYIRRIGGKV
jgi:hypothetical protein